MFSKLAVGHPLPRSGGGRTSRRLVEGRPQAPNVDSRPFLATSSRKCLSLLREQPLGGQHPSDHARTYWPYSHICDGGLSWPRRLLPVLFQLCPTESARGSPNEARGAKVVYGLDASLGPLQMTLRRVDGECGSANAQTPEGSAGTNYFVFDVPPGRYHAFADPSGYVFVVPAGKLVYIGTFGRAVDEGVAQPSNTHPSVGKVAALCIKRTKGGARDPGGTMRAGLKWRRFRHRKRTDRSRPTSHWASSGECWCAAQPQKHRRK
jgi:hypothetical protein